MSSSILLTSDGGALLDVSLLLTVCLTVTAVFAIVQLARIANYSAPPGSFWRGTCCLPWTVQKQMHMILALATACRIGFLVVADFVWDSTTGMVASDSSWYLRAAFYTLDEVCLLLYFSAALTVALFWAQIYYQAEGDDIHGGGGGGLGGMVYYSLMSYVVNRLHVLAYLGSLAIILALNGSFSWWTATGSSSSYYYYMSPVAAYYVSSLYLVASVLLVWYARLTVRGVTQVPIEIHVRKRKQREIWSMSLLLVGALVVRLVLLSSVVGGRALVLTTWGQWAGVFLYYWMLENAPALVVLWYFHRMPSASTSSHDMAPLMMTAAHHHHEEEDNKGALSRLLGGGSGGQHQLAHDKISAEMIEHSLKRLALLHQKARSSHSKDDDPPAV